MRPFVLALVLMGCGRSELYLAPVAGPAPGVDAGCTPACGADARCDGSRCLCLPGFEGDGVTCTDVAAQLNGLRWELPCLSSSTEAPDFVCFTRPTHTFQAKLSGRPGRAYAVELRIRGVVETKDYRPVPFDAGHFIVGGVPIEGDAWNAYLLSTTDPLATYRLNHGPSGLYQCVAVDYTVTVRAMAGSDFILFASPVDERLSQIRNNVAQPIIVPGVPPAPMAFDGQFLQMDVVRVTPLP